MRPTRLLPVVSCWSTPMVSWWRLTRPCTQCSVCRAAACLGINLEAYETSSSARTVAHCHSSSFPISQALRHGVPVHGRIVGLRRRDGTLVWVQGDAVPLLDCSGAVRQVVTSFVDVSTRVRVEDALRRSTAEMRVMVSNTPTILYTIDVTGTLVLCEGRGLEIFGRTPQDLVGTSSFEVFRNYPGMIAALRSALSGHEATLSSAAYGHHFEIRIVPLRDDDQCVVGATGLALDVTELVQAQQALQASEAQFRRIVETAGEGIWVLNADLVTTFVNRRLADMLGYSSEEMLGRAVFEFMTDAERSRALQDVDVRKELPSDQFDRTFLAKDGTPVMTAIAATQIRDNAGVHVGMLAMVSDVTARRQMERALERTNGELARSNAELQQFASVASHDLRSPLNTIGGYAELLSLRYSGLLDADGAEFLGLIVDAVKLMQALIDDLLLFARLGAQPSPARHVDCTALVDCVTKQLRSAIRESDAVIIYQDLPTLYGRESQLRQLFQNLIDNSIKFRREEAPPRVTISAERQDQDWLFVLEDNGIGVDPAYTDRIFVIFRRLHSREEYPGTGIGLAICRKIVEQHGGRIWAEPQVGHGTRFLFTCRYCWLLSRDPDSWFVLLTFGTAWGNLLAH